MWSYVMELGTTIKRHLPPIRLLRSPHITFYSCDLGAGARCAIFPGKNVNGNIKSMYGILGNAHI